MVRAQTMEPCTVATCFSRCRCALNYRLKSIKVLRTQRPIAVVPFAWQGVGSASEDVAQIVDSDLARSGQFSPVSRRDMLSYPTRESELFFRDWRAISADYVLIGRVSVGSQARIDFQLFDTTRQEAVGGRHRYRSGRRAPHACPPGRRFGL